MSSMPTHMSADIAVVHAFVNTLDLRSFTYHGTPHQGGDYIASPAGLTAWLRARGLLATGVRSDGVTLRHAHELREQLRLAVAQGLADGLRNHGTPVTMRLAFQLSIGPGQPPALVPAGTDVNAALAQIALCAVRAAESDTWTRLKMCAAPDCRWVFYDRSRPGRGRWCAPELCANRMKTRAYRQRRR